MADLNSGSFVGRVVADAKKETYGNSAENVRVDVCICNNAYVKNEKYPNFFNISLFGKHGENLLPYLKKGQCVSVEYHLKQDRWEKDGKKFSRISIITDDVKLIGSVKKSNSENTDDSMAAEEEAIQMEFENSEFEDPFSSAPN